MRIGEGQSVEGRVTHLKIAPSAPIRPLQLHDITRSFRTFGAVPFKRRVGCVAKGRDTPSSTELVDGQIAVEQVDARRRFQSFGDWCGDIDLGATVRPVACVDRRDYR